MTSGFFNRDVMRGLTIRVLLFLSLALLPIGLIAVVQTRQIAEQSRLSSELSLLAVTEQASSAERRVIQEGFGAAEALASIVRLWRSDTDLCSAFLREYQKNSGAYSLVGFVEADGDMKCSSADQPLNFSEDEAFKSLQADPVRRATAGRDAAVNQKPATVINIPVFDEKVLIGFMILSIPHATVDRMEEAPLTLTPAALVTINKNGDVLTTEKGLEIAEAEYPVNTAMSLFTSKESHVFRAKNVSGTERIYAVLPIVPNTVYAMSVWPSDTPFVQSDLSTRLSALLPIAMWLASLIVAFWALNRLAITHIRKLGRQMRRFALNRTLPTNTLGSSVPTELVEMESAFIGMAESILRDEATLEDGLRQKNILLKEVHHRVKNNLQLISSIMNMQIRQASTEDARQVLRRLQERILSLATVHKNLYQNDDLVSVDASGLLREIVNQILSVGLAPGSDVKVEQHYENILLDADDAAPITLLVSEAVTNALKHLPNADGEEAKISVDLRYDGKDRAKLVISNTVGDRPAVKGTGLGSRLILAFARQLNGQIDVVETERSHILTVQFPVPLRIKEVYDY